MTVNQADYAQRIFAWIDQDKKRLKALKCLQQIDMPTAYIAAGFVRNLVWDHLHNKTQSTPLNDVDVIYYDANEGDAKQHLVYECILANTQPQMNWQVRNQAKMHIKKGHAQYADIVQAMSFWPEKETAVAIRLANNASGYECISAFGLASLFKLELTYNRSCSFSIFQHRMSAKDWLSTWPKLAIRV